MKIVLKCSFTKAHAFRNQLSESEDSTSPSWTKAEEEGVVTLGGEEVL